jgi:hypothetical protein
MHRTIAPFAAFALVAAPHLAEAKIACYPIDRMETALVSEYGERRQFTGAEGEGVEYRLYVNRDTGSWSWVGIPKGTNVACVLFAGKIKEDTPAAPGATKKREPVALF